MNCSALSRPRSSHDRGLLGRPGFLAFMVSDARRMWGSRASLGLMAFFCLSG